MSVHALVFMTDLGRIIREGQEINEKIEELGHLNETPGRTDYQEEQMTYKAIALQGMNKLHLPRLRALIVKADANEGEMMTASQRKEALKALRMQTLKAELRQIYLDELLEEVHN